MTGFNHILGEQLSSQRLYYDELLQEKEASLLSLQEQISERLEDRRRNRVDLHERVVTGEQDCANLKEEIEQLQKDIETGHRQREQLDRLSEALSKKVHDLEAAGKSVAPPPTVSRKAKRNAEKAF